MDATNPLQSGIFTDARVADAQDLERACQSDPAIRQAVQWLDGNGHDAFAVVGDALAKLRKRGRSLPAANREKYIRSVVCGEFLFRWRIAHDGSRWQDIVQDPDSGVREVELILLSHLDARAFKNARSKLARVGQDRAFNIQRGSNEEFESFVTDHSRLFAQKFFENFDPSRPGAVASVLPYMRITAASLFLSKRTRPVRSGMPNVLDYLETSSRLKDRTKIAVKLAYFPYLLGQQECERIRRDYGWEVSTCKLYPIKEIAARLGFQSAAALSRRLYKVRDWCQRSTRQQEASDVSASQ